MAPCSSSSPLAADRVITRCITRFCRYSVATWSPGAAAPRWTTSPAPARAGPRPRRATGTWPASPARPRVARQAAPRPAKAPATGELARRRGKAKAQVAVGNTQLKVYHKLLSNPGMRYTRTSARTTTNASADHPPDRPPRRQARRPRLRSHPRPHPRPRPGQASKHPGRLTHIRLPQTHATTTPRGSSPRAPLRSHFRVSETGTAEAGKAQVLGLDGLERPQGTLGLFIISQPAKPWKASFRLVTWVICSRSRGSGR